ncbi:MAG: ABC transporter permease [Candidatus Thorarchaeota archaeon]
MSLRSYIITRIILTIPMIMFLLTLVFMILRVVPGDPALLHFEKAVDPEVLEAFRVRLGLDKPPIEQYFEYLTGLFQGDFGTSMHDYSSVSGHIAQRFPATLELTMYSMLFAVIVGVLLGVQSSKRYNKPADTGIRLFGIITYALPVFFFGMILQMIFSIWLGWFPTGGRFSGRYEAPVGPIVEVWYLALNLLTIVGAVVCLAFFVKWYRARRTQEERSPIFWPLIMIPVILSVLLPLALTLVSYEWWGLFVSLYVLVDVMLFVGIAFFFGKAQFLTLKEKTQSFLRSNYLRPAIFSGVFLFASIYVIGTQIILWDYFFPGILILDIGIVVAHWLYMRRIRIRRARIESEHGSEEIRVRNIAPISISLLVASGLILGYKYIIPIITGSLVFTILLLVDFILLPAALLQLRRKKVLDEDGGLRRFWMLLSGTVAISLAIPIMLVVFGTDFTYSGTDLTTGLYTVDSLMSGDWWSFTQSVTYLILPSVTLGTVLCGIFIRLTRTNMLETLRTDFVVAGEARGLSDRTITYGYALRNAFLPILTMIGLQFAALLAGAVLTETTFNWRGLGTYLVARINFRDYTGIQGVVVFFGIFVTFVTLVMDIIYAYLDPRIRL